MEQKPIYTSAMPLDWIILRCESAKYGIAFDTIKGDTYPIEKDGRIATESPTNLSEVELIDWFLGLGPESARAVYDYEQKQKWGRVFGLTTVLYRDITIPCIEYNYYYDEPSQWVHKFAFPSYAKYLVEVAGDSELVHELMEDKGDVGCFLYMRPFEDITDVFNKNPYIIVSLLEEKDPAMTLCSGNDSEEEED